MLCSIKLDGNKIKRCAFCKHWYDPANQYIKPQDPRHGFWKFEDGVKCKCLQKNIDMCSGHHCEKFDSKTG